jgi:uncharacterized protein
MVSKRFKYLIYIAVFTAFSSAIADDRVEFFRAVNIDHVGAVNKLLAAGFDPNTTDDKGQVPLFVALREEAPRVVKALLAHPALKVDQANAAGETPLMMAALRGNLEAAAELIAKGAAVNRSGWTPLHYAASSEHPPVVKLLLDKGAALEAPSPNKTTPLMMASRYGSEADFARLAGREALARRFEALPP